MNSNLPDDFWEQMAKLPLILEGEFKTKQIMKEFGGCKQCGWCCRNERLSIFLPDIKKLGPLLKPEHIRNKDEISMTLHLPCPLINIKNRCDVYSRRPGICRTYPFILHYLGQITIAYDCPLGRKISDDIIKYCESIGIPKVGEDKKTPDMKIVDQMVKDKGLNSGKGYSSDIINVPFEIYERWLKKRYQNI